MQKLGSNAGLAAARHAAGRPCRTRAWRRRDRLAPGLTARSPGPIGAAVAHDARRMAQALEALGVKPGDRVATLAMNHSHHLTSWYGAIGMGGVLHTINPRLFDEQLEYIANHAEDRVLLYDHVWAPVVERMKPKWTTIEKYVCFDPPAGWNGDISFTDWLAPHDGNYQWVDGDERDPCGLCYTSRHHRQSQGRALRASLEHAPRHGRDRARLLRPLGAGGGAADRADVPCQCLGHPLGGADVRLQADPVGRLSSRPDVRPVPRREGHPLAPAFRPSGLA